MKIGLFKLSELLTTSVKCCALFVFLLTAFGINATTWVVNSTQDDQWNQEFNAPITTAGVVTLRSVIEFLNSDSSAFTPGDMIAFSFPATQKPPYIIQPGGPSSPQPGVPLPQITKKVIIDGYLGSPGGAKPNTDQYVTNARLTVVINGSNYSVGNGFPTGTGLFFDTGSVGSIIRGLVINEWLAAGIYLNDKNISVLGCFIGTNPKGTAQMANAAGVYCAGANSIVGTHAPFNVADRNLIAGSFNWLGFEGGVVVATGGDGTSIMGNLIGLDKTGKKTLGNSQAGMRIFANQVIIGGIKTAARNIISGHSIVGIFIQGAGSKVQGNYVGTNASGTKALNKLKGIGIGLFTEIATSNTIGGPQEGEGNVVSGWNAGVSIGLNIFLGTSRNTVQGNFIGTDHTGTIALANIDGILVNSADNLIGGANPGEGNVISGNFNTGITIYGSEVFANRVQGNRIGVSADLKCGKIKPLGNGFVGIQIGVVGGHGGSSLNIIGGDTPNKGNFIGANGKYGINIENFSSDNLIRNNTFGTHALANGEENIHFSNSKSNIIINN